MIKGGKIKLKQVERALVTTIVDNYTDVLLASHDNVQRAALIEDGKRTAPLLAEHGLSFCIEVMNNLEQHMIIMDFGLSNIAVPNNISVLNIDLSKVETFVISHGHHDHIGSIQEVYELLSKPVDIVVHPNAFLESRLHVFPDGREVPIPSLKREKLDGLNCTVVKISSPISLASGYIATLTNIPRRTDFEKGMPTAHYREKGKLYKDDILDDMAVVISVKNKGLVIITGCGHAGIINTVLYAREVTGINDIYAVIGGFHLTGSIFEPIIERTIEEMKKFSPRIIVPTHCTGWKAMVAFEKAFPDSFILNSVGSKILL